MISFIVIGKNIAFTVGKCFSSIYVAAKSIGLEDFEVIYVDSKSTDQTLQILHSFPGVRSFLITGDCNAAIARNIGAKEAKGESLFFLDGDMELCSNFLNVVYNETFKQNYRFVSGDLLNNFYDQNEVFLREAPYFNKKLQKDRTEYTTGGFFVIERVLWVEVKGMRTCFRRGQDLDLGLRLAKKGNFLLRKKELMAIHHTISYFDKKRFVKMLKKGDYLYPSVLMRKNFFNIYTWKELKKTHSSTICLAFLLIISVVFSFYFLLLYLIAIVIRSALKKDKQGRSIMFHLFAFFLIDLTVLVGFLFFHPKEQDLKYKVFKS